MSEFNEIVKFTVMQTLGLSFRRIFIDYETKYERCTGGGDYGRTFVRFCDKSNFSLIGKRILSRNTIANNVERNCRYWGISDTISKQKTHAALKRLEKQGLLKLEKSDKDFDVVIDLEEYEDYYNLVRDAMKKRIKSLSGDMLRRDYFMADCQDEIFEFCNKHWPVESLKK